MAFGLLLLIASATAAAEPASASATAAAAKPNILLLFPDQWRWDWTPANPAVAAGLPMPHLDSLRAAGTHFRKAFVPAPLCAPSRACLAAGREYDAAGVPDNFSNDYPVNQTTFYSLLRDAGYVVLTSGKDDLTKATGPGLNGSFHADALGFTQSARCDGKDDATGASPHDPFVFPPARSADKTARALTAQPEPPLARTQRAATACFARSTLKP